MKKGINLITRHKKYLHYEGFFLKLRIGLIIVAVVFFIVFSGFFYFLLHKNNQYNQLILEKKKYLEYLDAHKEVEAEFAYFRNKQNQLVSILGQDVQFLPYYNLVVESLKTASPEPKLESIIISKDRTINFTLRFENSGSIINFLRFAESDNFLKSFSQLVISSFNIEEKKDNKKYQLNFSGTLIPFNETKN
ncbi:hypothetical protein COS31_05565 [Candidatus Roizmanbacteria bacterium CG02_land_8_20_14_3_00_36_15]|uniref:PilN domain-containing protein n=2 Tax=Candidatus Roizmaniibacteriota TaxID=1752723 RepID=A0A2M8KL12_9BACT|nr:MAG: hypothetical protein COS51_01545 [Candidatus Roizmanbacteria bacterium CG03_land_8_20_14_0_80_36_21]PIV37278.1 MAG: hypothetical protein COS31_05565 [Candidatus Roizmanbacteria bacterium CG02_land_8_20_14_3_00_36_15]PIY70647.1 MAG: hypothetical protein COY89_00010 [Candidatus Roizmanbacteria bacterium CG_4_10_14_0_8_um_filter_36_36]PJA53100.1 MAG: hypothetical protein CO166_03000 [Candidatus Roizmanbacteria bacterium CG_4_9_14_3_um_filter_36_11]PJC81285.1 MAG: hypothetical protein CO007